MQKVRQYAAMIPMVIGALALSACGSNGQGDSNTTQSDDEVTSTGDGGEHGDCDHKCDGEDGRHHHHGRHHDHDGGSCDEPDSSDDDAGDTPVVATPTTND